MTSALNLTDKIFFHELACWAFKSTMHEFTAAIALQWNFDWSNTHFYYRVYVFVFPDISGLGNIPILKPFLGPFIGHTFLSSGVGFGVCQFSYFGRNFWNMLPIVGKWIFSLLSMISLVIPVCIPSSLCSIFSKSLSCGNCRCLKFLFFLLFNSVFYSLQFISHFIVGAVFLSILLR